MKKGGVSWKKVVFYQKCGVLYKKVAFHEKRWRFKFLRYLVNGGLRRQETEQYTRKDGTEGEFAKYLMTNAEIYSATKAESLESYINKQRSKWIANCVRAEDNTFIKQLTFPDFFKSDKKKRGIMSTTYRQVKIYHEKELNITENEMINNFVKESSGVTGPEIQ